jgi:drug/metabolite transporter (DMT)-like permease
MTPSAAPPAPASRAAYLFLVLLTLMWGVNWPMNKAALAEIPPWTFRALMVPVSGLILLGLAAASRLPLALPRRLWGPLALATAGNVTLWHVFSAYGIGFVASGHAAVLAFTMPLWATLLGVLVLGDRLDGRRLAALGLGMGGVAVLAWDDIAAAGSRPFGVLLMLAAAVAWGFGTVVQKKVAWDAPTVVLAGWQILLGGLPIVAVAVPLEGDLWQPARWSWGALAVVLYNIVGPQTFCYYAWFRIVAAFPASVAAIGTLMIPVVGSISGTLSLAEPLGWREAAALVLVCGSLALVLVRR